MTLILFGQFCLLGAFVGTGYAACACILGWLNDHRSVRRSGVVVAASSVLALTAAVVILVYALFVKDFRFAYVANYSSRLLPWHYSVSSLWVGQAGSLLLWAWLSGLLALAFRFLPSREANVLREPAFGVLMSFCCFLVASMVFAADPMEASIAPPDNGLGLSPILQHPSMLIHPPIVFLGYSAWAIPFALAVTALATGQLNTSWTRHARPWALFAWLVLGSGVLLGAQWAYGELGWGGYWAWDPVENGSLMPWLLGSASIHTMMAWRYRGMLKKSALVLTIATFGMCNFATFLTRSGIFSSLHAFSQSSIGWLFLGLMVALSLTTVVLVVMRRNHLRHERSVQTFWCRESMVIGAAIALVAFAVVTCVGTVSTAISDALLGRKIVVGPAFYNNALIPTGLVLLATTAVAPLLNWGTAPTQLQRRMLMISTGVGTIAIVMALLCGVRHPISLLVGGLSAFSVAALVGSIVIDGRRQPSGNVWLRLGMALRTGRRQYAGFLIHMGLFCLALGISGSSLGARRHETSMREGETVVWAGRRVRLAKITQRELPDKFIAEAHLEVRQGTAQPHTLTPAQHYHILQEEWTSEVDIHSTWTGDFYTILHDGDEPGSVRLTFVEIPMMRWIWLGGLIMGVGCIVSLWPAKRSSRVQSAPTKKRTTNRRQSPQKQEESIVAPNTTTTRKEPAANIR